jgi:N-acetylglucosamine kinase-like BadF-type ATPase
VLGIDLGGTQCRALLADTDGVRHGVGHARGGNPGSDPAGALRGVANAVAGALEGNQPAAVRSVVLGAAGYAAVTSPPTAQALARVWAEAGLDCPVRVRPDCEVAFAAGTPDPNGIVLVAGTGSMAARIEDHVMVGRVGGHGWVLGDEGSGFWLGREAVRSTLRMLETGAPASDLVRRILAAVLDGARPPADPLRTIGAITTWVHQKAPSGVAALAPLVYAAAGVGDVEAGSLLKCAAGLLAEMALTLWRSSEPTVLAGTLLTAGSVATLVVDRLRAAGACVYRARDTVAGAAFLAALDHQANAGRATDPVQMHVQLMDPAPAQGRRTARSPG